LRRHSVLPLALASGSRLTAEGLAGEATNPFANLMQFQFQFQYQYNASHYNTDDTSTLGVVQPVIPFKMPWKSVPLMITRTTIPYVTTPETDLRPGRPPPLINLPDGGFVEAPTGLSSQSAWGDIVSFGLFLPKLKAKGQTIGIGPVVSLPLRPTSLRAPANGRSARRSSISTPTRPPGSGVHSPTNCGASPTARKTEPA